MRSSVKLIFALLISIFWMSGCAGTFQQLQNMVTSPTEYYRQKALAFEKNNEL